MRKFTSITLVLLCTITFTGQSDENSFDNPFADILEKPAKLSVEVQVTSSDENTKAHIESYLKRELRSLQDVEIVDTGNRFRIVIVALEPKYKVSGNKTGDMIYAYRFADTTHINDYPHIWDYFRENSGKIPPEVHNDLGRLFAVSDLLALSERIYTMRIVYFDTNDLKRNCEELVAEFDTKVLEPERNRK